MAASHITIHLPSMKSYEYSQHKYNVEIRTGCTWKRYDDAIVSLSFDGALDLARDICRLCGVEARLVIAE